jgi:hypothetical protein
MAQKIEALPAERLREMQHFVTSMANIARVGSRLAHRQIDIEKCTHYLRELRVLKTLVDKLQHNQDSKDERPEDHFNLV